MRNITNSREVISPQETTEPRGAVLRAKRIFGVTKWNTDMRKAVEAKDWSKVFKLSENFGKEPK